MDKQAIREIIECFSVDMGNHLDVTRLDELVDALFTTHTLAIDAERAKYRDRVVRWKETAADLWLTGNREMASGINSCADDLATAIDTPHAG